MSFNYLSPKAVTRTSPLHGRGTFAVEPIAAGELVVFFGGYVTSAVASLALDPAVERVTLMLHPGFVLGPRTLDEMGDGDFVNHSCAPNCGIRGHVALVARTAIAPGAELTFDYGTVVFEATTGPFTMPCNCGAPHCRRVVSSDDWRDPAFRALHRGFLSMALEDVIAAHEAEEAAARARVG